MCPYVHKACTCNSDIKMSSVLSKRTDACQVACEYNKRIRMHMLMFRLLRLFLCTLGLYLGATRGRARDVLCEVVADSSEIAAEVRRMRSDDHEGLISAGLKIATLRRLSTIFDT